MSQNIFEIPVRTSSHTQMIDITRQVQQAVNESGVTDGLCIVFVPHTTAAVTINENAEAVPLLRAAQNLQVNFA